MQSETRRQSHQLALQAIHVANRALSAGSTHTPLRAPRSASARATDARLWVRDPLTGKLYRRP